MACVYKWRFKRGLDQVLKSSLASWEHIFRLASFLTRISKKGHILQPKTDNSALKTLDYLKYVLYLSFYFQSFLIFLPHIISPLPFWQIATFHKSDYFSSNLKKRALPWFLTHILWKNNLVLPKKGVKRLGRARFLRLELNIAPKKSSIIKYMPVSTHAMIGFWSGSS